MKKKLDIGIIKDIMDMEVDISNLPIFEVDKWVISRADYKVTVKELMENIDKLERMEREVSKARLALTGALNEALAVRQVYTE